MIGLMSPVPILKKSKLLGFQCDEIMHRRVIALARSQGFDTYADWMRTVITHALEAESLRPTATAEPAILAKLATTYAGHIAPRLAAALGTADQPQFLHDVIVDLDEWMKAGYRPEALALAPRSRIHHPETRGGRRPARGGRIHKTDITGAQDDPTVNDPPPTCCECSA